LGSFGGVWRCQVDLRWIIQAQFTSYSYLSTLDAVSWCSNWLHLRSRAIDRGLILGVSSHSGGLIVVGWKTSAVFGGVRWTLDALFKFNSPAIHILAIWVQCVLALKKATLGVKSHLQRDHLRGYSGGIISFWWLDSGRVGSCGGVWRC
jgi:hypothetical protein